MSVSERLQERRDQLLEYLELTHLEKRFIELCHRNNTAARRVALLIAQYCDADRRMERESLLRLLIEEAVPTLRRAIEVASMSVPDGYTVVPSQQLQALRAVAGQALALAETEGGMERAHALERLKHRLVVAVNLDKELAKHGRKSAQVFRVT